MADGKEASVQDLLAWYEGKVATWSKPDDVAFVDELPHTATGKVKKIELRRQFADYQFPELS
jgi:fatty-acyl-CoA synthase